MGFHSDLSHLVRSFLSSLTRLFSLQMKPEDYVYLEGLGSEHKAILFVVLGVLWFAWVSFSQLVLIKYKYKGLQLSWNNESY